MSLRKPGVKTVIVPLLFILWVTSLSSHSAHSWQTQPVNKDFRAEGGPSLVSAEMGRIFAIHQAGDTLLISTEKGLYRWNDKLEGKPELAALSTSSGFAFHQVGDILLIGTDNGLYRWNVRLEGGPEIVDAAVGLPRSFYSLNGALLIAAENGLFRWNERLEGKPELVDETIISATHFSQLDDALLFTDSERLYRWNVRLAGKPERVPAEVDSFRSLYQVGDTLLLGTERGLYRWDAKLAGGPSPVDAGMGTIIAFNQVGDNLLISAEQGVYKWNVRLEGSPMLLDAELRMVFAVRQIGDTLLLGARDGVYRWNIQLKGRPALLPTEIKRVVDFQEINDILLIICVGKLYRWNDELEGQPEVAGDSIAAFDFSRQVGDTLLIGAAGGLYRWNSRLEGPIQPVITIMGHVRCFHQSEGGLLVGADEGLYRWNDRLEGGPRLMDEPSGPVTALYQVGDTLLMGVEGRGSGGILRWNDRLEGRPAIDVEVGNVLAFYKTGETLLIGTEMKLYRWNVNLEASPIPIDTAVGSIAAFHRLGDVLLVGAAGGLYQWNDRLEGKPELLDGEIGSVYALHQTGGALLVGTHRGLFKIGGLGAGWNADIGVDALPARILSSDGVTVKWVIRNYEQRANPQNVRIRLSVKDGNGAVVSKDAQGKSITPEQWRVPTGQQQFTTPALPPGTYSLTLQATDLTGNTSESRPVNFRVYASPEEFALDWGRYLTSAYAALTVLMFLILVVGARRSRRCFDLLTDPVVRKLGIYFGFALRYIRPVRLWVFERYFDELKKEWADTDNYITYHLIPPDEGSDRTPAAPVESVDIIKRLRYETRILILGGPGTGKSALVGNLMRTYCQEASLRAAWKKYGFIPVVVRLRELAGSQGIKVTELARSALDGKGMSFNREDLFFESLLRDGDFLIILDGLNEVNVDEAVDEFAVTHPSVRLLATSQTNSLSASFKRYILPFFDPEFAQALLRKFVGDGPATKAIKEAPELWRDIKCGYDVRLVEYLIKSSTADGRQTLTAGGEKMSLPTNRLELYRAMIEFSKIRYEQSAIQMKAFPYVRICERAWNMWRNGQYLFQPDESLTQSEVEHLMRTNLALKREHGYEFMHSLMRDFLGAEFCTRHSGPTKLMIQTRLQGEDADKIWKLPPDDQAPVFSFLTESIKKVEDLGEVYQFASEKIKERHELMIAVQEAAKKKGWQIEVNINVE